ncbi:nickel-dependent hydrogenase large subunit [Candidatus Aerophobetes bacterium]|nr:nickel-dependent hydrogenase large subunit [Candidatus Aerophobetes bacterium]
MINELIIRPFPRIGGDLEIKVSLDDSKVVDSYCSGTAFRGFENLLKGKSVMDCLGFVCRICGVCGVSHSIAASKAMKKIFGVKVPQNGYLCKNISLATEIVLNQLGHFYLLFAPDLTDKRYSCHPLYPEVAKRFSALSGTSYKHFIHARRKLLVIMGLFAGKWPNTLAVHPGGVTKTLNKSELIRCLGSLVEFRNFLEQNLLGCDIDDWLEKKNLKDIESLCSQNNYHSDLGIFAKFGKEIGLPLLGKSTGKFLCYSGYENAQGKSLYKSGFYNSAIYPLEVEKITEEQSFSFFEGEKAHPFEGFTEPFVEKKKAYSWVKSPRYSGEVVEVGPLSRMVINEDSLISDLFEKMGSNVYSRVLARLHEAIFLTSKIGEWLKRVNPNKPFYNKVGNIKRSKGEGLIEAARGALGHWIKVEKGYVKNYQIITPSSWNFSPRDSLGVPGILEQTLIGTTLKEPTEPLEIFHIVRSYDPCFFCSVHVSKVRKRK